MIFRKKLRKCERLVIVNTIYRGGRGRGGGFQGITTLPKLKKFMFIPTNLYEVILSITISSVQRRLRRNLVVSSGSNYGLPLFDHFFDFQRKLAVGRHLSWRDEVSNPQLLFKIDGRIESQWHKFCEILCRQCDRILRPVRIEGISFVLKQKYEKRNVDTSQKFGLLPITS